MILIEQQENQVTAKLSNNSDKPHDWCSKAHLKEYIKGFQLYPTVESFIISKIVPLLHEKCKDVHASKLMR